MFSFWTVFISDVNARGTAPAFAYLITYVLNSSIFSDQKSVIKWGLNGEHTQGDPKAPSKFLLKFGGEDNSSNLLYFWYKNIFLQNFYLSPTHRYRRMWRFWPVRETDYQICTRKLKRSCREPDTTLWGKHRQSQYQDRASLPHTYSGESKM